MPQSMSPTNCLCIEKSVKEGQSPISTVEASEKMHIYLTDLIGCSERSDSKT
jgi:hypothetical protein